MTTLKPTNYALKMTLEGSVAGSILLGFKTNENHENRNTRTSGHQPMGDEIPVKLQSGWSSLDSV